MYVIENCLNGNFEVEYINKVNSFTLIYKKDNKVKYNCYKHYSLSELNYAIYLATKIGSNFEEIIYSKLKYRKREFGIYGNLNIKDNITKIGTLKNLLEKTNYSDINLCYKIYELLCYKFKIKKNIKEPFIFIESNTGNDIIDNTGNESYRNELKNELSSILNNIKLDELNFSVELFYKFNLEDELFKLLILGDFKGFSSEFRYLKRSIITFCNKFCSPCFIHIPQKISYNIKKESSLEIINKLNFINSYEYGQLSSFNSVYLTKNMYNEYDNFRKNIYSLKNEIFVNLYDYGFIINELNINLNPFIYTCFWLYRLIPISNKYITKKYGSINEISFFQDVLISYFNKSVSAEENPINTFIEEVRKINNRITKDTSFCNYTKLNETKKENISFNSDIESYDTDVTIYSNITLCMWKIFYNNYFLKEVFVINADITSIKHNVCIKCNKDIVGKKHFIRDINSSNNKYDILPYLCDNCMIERNKESGKKRISKFRNKNSN